MLLWTVIFVLAVISAPRSGREDVLENYTVCTDVDVWVEQEAHRININTAGEEELEQLDGIGPVLAQRIVDRRAAVGTFTCPEDLLEVRGIGPKTLEKMRYQIMIEEEP